VDLPRDGRFGLASGSPVIASEAKQSSAGAGRLLAVLALKAIGEARQDWIASLRSQ
jgi:hypothetical protein